MAITNGYCTLAELKARLSVTDTADDSVFENVIETASRAIDNHCHRRFWKDTADTTRVYTACTSNYVRINDLVTVTTLKTDETGDRVYERTWATTDYDLDPADADDDSRPFTKVTVSPLGRYRFPVSHSRAVEIVGRFGWPAVPDVVNEACLIQSARLYRRKDSPLGVAGSADFGQLRLLNRLDPDVELLVAPLRKMLVG